MIHCYVKRLCNNLKKLIRVYTKTDNQLKLYSKPTNVKGFVYIPSSSAILLG